MPLVRLLLSRLLAPNEGLRSHKMLSQEREREREHTGAGVLDGPSKPSNSAMKALKEENKDLKEQLRHTEVTAAELAREQRKAQAHAMKVCSKISPVMSFPELVVLLRPRECQ